MLRADGLRSVSKERVANHGASFPHRVIGGELPKVIKPLLTFFDLRGILLVHSIDDVGPRLPDRIGRIGYEQFAIGGKKRRAVLVALHVSEIATDQLGQFGRQPELADLAGLAAAVDQ